jgi:glutaredoxin
MKPIIYTIDNCVYCDALEDWMEQRGILYETRDATNPEIEAELERVMGREMDVAPTTLIGDEVIEGFNRPAILKALRRNGNK